MPEPDEHVRDVPTIRHEVGVRRLSRNSEDITLRDGVARPTGDRGAKIACTSEHLATDQQGSFSALDEDHIVDLVVLLGRSVAVSANEPKAMRAGRGAVIGQGLAGRAVLPDVGTESRVPLLQFRHAPGEEAWSDLHRQCEHDRQCQKRGCHHHGPHSKMIVPKLSYSWNDSSIGDQLQYVRVPSSWSMR